MQKVIKISCVLCAIVALLSLFVFTVTAASSQCYFNPTNFEITSCQVSFDNTSTWSSPSSYTFSENDNGSGHLTIAFGGGTATHWRAAFEPLTGAGNLSITEGMQLNATFYYSHYAEGNYHIQTITGALYITAPDGTIYEFPVTNQYSSDDETYYIIEVGGTIGVVDSFNFQDAAVEFLFSGISNTAGVTLDFQQFGLTCKEVIGEETAAIVDSIEQGFADLQDNVDQNTQDIIDNQNQNTQDIIANDNANTDKITDNQDENTDKIIANQDENTDEILNGWETDNNIAGETDSVVGDLGSAEDEALGGKSDEDIEEEINNALSLDGLPDPELDNIIVVGDTFEALLNSFGSEYQSLLLLSLVLGLASFLIGRQYTSKGG